MTLRSDGPAYLEQGLPADRKVQAFNNREHLNSMSSDAREAEARALLAPTTSDPICDYKA